MIFSVITVAALGLVVTGYGLYVEKQLKDNVQYKPMCDISDMISCSKPINSAYGKHFGIPNIILGMIFYASMIVLSMLGFTTLVQLGAAVGLIATFYFAYILYFKVQSLCLICTTTYVINILLFIAAISGR